IATHLNPSKRPRRPVRSRVAHSRADAAIDICRREQYRPPMPTAAAAPSGCGSVAHRRPVAARIGPALEEPLIAVDADGMGVSQIVVPIRDHLHRLSPALQLAHDLVRDTALERETARVRPPGAAHQPARGFYG